VELSFNELFEMKYLLLLLSFLVSSNSALNECDLPDGFKVTNTFERNGVLTVLDEFGNGANIYTEEGGMSTKENPFDDYNLEIIEEIKFRDGGYLARFENNGPIDPFDTAFYFRKNEMVVYTFLYMDGDSSTHGVFEGKSIQLARKIAQGGRDNETWSNCWSFSFNFDDWRRSRKG
jgi:hypothetical protein